MLLVSESISQMEVAATRLYVTPLFALLVSLSTSVWGDVKSKKEIGAEAKSKARQISAQQLADYMASDKEFVLLDVRTEAEFEAWISGEHTFYNRYGELKFISDQETEQ